MTIDTSDLRQFGLELRAMRLAFRAAHGHEPTRVIWSGDVEDAVIEQEREVVRRMNAAGIPGMELDGSTKAIGLRFLRVDGPPNTFYVDDKEGDAP